MCLKLWHLFLDYENWIESALVMYEQAEKLKYCLML